MPTGQDAFEIIQEEIVVCRRCPRLVEWREQAAVRKVRRFRSEKYWGRPVPAFGDSDAALVIIGLAPAAHGANRTGRMFTGDRSGEWLFEALHQFGFADKAASWRPGDGLRLRHCLITAAVRCAPPANRPSPEELSNCSFYLTQELILLRNKRVILVLGNIAFRAFLKAWQEIGETIPGKRPQFRHGGEWQLARGLTLVSSYHPSQQNTLTKRLTRPMFHQVFRRVRRLIDGSGSRVH